MIKKNVKKSNFEVERRRKFDEFQEKCRSRKKRKSTATEEFTSEGECAQGTGQQKVLRRQEFVIRSKNQDAVCLMMTTADHLILSAVLQDTCTYMREVMAM